MQATLWRVTVLPGQHRGWANRIAATPMLARRRIAALLPASVFPIIPMVEDAPRVLDRRTRRRVNKSVRLRR